MIYATDIAIIPLKMWCHYIAIFCIASYSYVVYDKKVYTLSILDMVHVNKSLNMHWKLSVFSSGSRVKIWL